MCEKRGSRNPHILKGRSKIIKRWDVWFCSGRKTVVMDEALAHKFKQLFLPNVKKVTSSMSPHQYCKFYSLYCCWVCGNFTYWLHVTVITADVAKAQNSFSWELIYISLERRHLSRGGRWIETTPRTSC